jgi:uncharacterized membrane protein
LDRYRGRSSNSNICYTRIYYVCEAITKISARANKRGGRHKALCRKWSILALDLEVGSDIIRTILAPSESDLISLAVIVAIRITLSWSLSRDIKTN